MLPLNYIIFMPYGFLLFSMTVFGTLYSLSASHWLAVWAGLEINLIAFIPLMLYRGTVLETESAIKYFIFQAVGSALIMLGSLLSLGPDFIWSLSTNGVMLSLEKGVIILIIGLLLKLGAFPFHFWFPSVAGGISWFSNLLLFTWQKIAPLFLFFLLMCAWQAILMVPIMLAVVGSSIIGGIGGINQTQLRALLAYSSIAHMGWMLFCSYLSETSVKLYLSIYFFITACIFLLAWSTEMNLIFQAFSSFLGKNSMLRSVVMLLLLSLGGIPPLLGFVPKWVVLNLSEPTGLTITVMALILGSLFSLFYYLALVFSTFFSAGPLLMKNMTLTMSTTKSTYGLISASVIVNLMGGLAILMNFYMESFL
nr:TPA_asm: NADH dehydrogenase subunit 2 [Depressigyra globulus]